MMQMDASTRTHARVHMHMHTHTRKHTCAYPHTTHTHRHTHSHFHTDGCIRLPLLRLDVGVHAAVLPLHSPHPPSCCTHLRAHCIHSMHPIKHTRSAQPAVTSAAVFSAQRASAAASACSRSGESPASPLLLHSPCMWCSSSVCVASVAN